MTMSFASDENTAERGVAERSATGLDSQSSHGKSCSCSPMTMTDASTIESADGTLPSDDIDFAITQGTNKMRLEHHVHLFRDGWARLAAEQNNDENGSCFRGFSYLSKRLARYIEGRITNLSEQLSEFDMASDTHAKSLSAGQRRRVGEKYKPDECDLIMDEIYQEFDRYDRVLRYDREIQGLRSPPTYEVMGLYASLKKRGMLDDEALLFTNVPDDFVTTRPPEEHSLYLRKLFYGKFGWVLEKFLPLDEATGTWRAQTRVNNWVVGVVLTFFCVSTLLGPIAVMFLGELTKVKSFLVVLLAVSLFGAATVLTKNPETKFREPMMVVSAYVAVLASVLAQMAFPG